MYHGVGLAAVGEQKDDSEDTVGGALFVSGGHVPLVGVTSAFAHLLGVGCREEFVSLRQCTIGVAEHVGGGSKFLLGVVGGKCLVLTILIELELHGAV